ncbi:MAG TPA: hypothetical protein DCE18_06265 [Syntrophobacteraceae bacterium]|jgi:hypothetical protein|nr:hypothetical protein [Syntrophobacteraceae bacterium]HBZ54603.1 hypothetical protein [Syntrophobacteraceae bacterium]
MGDIPRTLLAGLQVLLNGGLAPAHADSAPLLAVAHVGVPNLLIIPRIVAESQRAGRTQILLDHLTTLGLIRDRQEVLLQIAIVMASISIVATSRMIFASRWSLR